MRDLKETVAAQKAKQKLTSKLALMVRNAIGGPAAGNINLMDDENEKGANITTEDTGDGMIKYQFNGDEMEAFVANDPSDGWFRLTEHLLREIAVGLDLPYEFIWNMAGLPGPAVRMVSAQAQRTFKAKMDMVENRFLNPVTAWWVNYEMQPGRLLSFNPEWHLFRFQRPAHLTIDNGRDSRSNLDELSAGVTTEEQICEEMGVDPDEMAEMRLSESRRKLTNARQLVDEFPEITLHEALDLIGRSNIPKAPSGFAAPAPEPAAQAA
jgi:capsid protein